MDRRILFILVYFLTLKTIGQTSLQSFRLVHEKKTDIVKDDDLVEIFYPIDGKSKNRKVTGFFRSITRDSITLDMIIIRDNKKITTDITKPGELYRFPVKEIESVVTERKKFENSMKAVFFTSLAGALIVSPLVSIENGKLNWDQVGKISGICAIPAVLSITFSLTLWDKHHQIKPNGKTKKLWTLEM